jgi:hypothetical protein
VGTGTYVYGIIRVRFLPQQIQSGAGLWDCGRDAWCAAGDSKGLRSRWYRDDASIGDEQLSLFESTRLTEEQVWADGMGIVWWLVLLAFAACRLLEIICEVECCVGDTFARGISFRIT